MSRYFFTAQNFLRLSNCYYTTHITDKADVLFAYEDH